MINECQCKCEKRNKASSPTHVHVHKHTGAHTHASSLDIEHIYNEVHPAHNRKCVVCNINLFAAPQLDLKENVHYFTEV